VAETLGVERRGGYYDRAGALRDIVQNHMMHLLCLVAMEPPVSLSADAIRNEKVKVLQALRAMGPFCAASGVVRAQYTAGTVDGEPVPGYRELPEVAGESATETYVAFRAFLDNWRWSGVPFYLRTGKRLAARRTEISIHFKAVPRVLFNAPPMGPLAPNVLAVRVQPDEGISIEFQVKAPAAAMRIQRLKMDFDYAEAFGSAPPEAYQRLLLDAALGDATLFPRRDEVEAAWKFVTPILEGCAMQPPDALATYPAGTWGPKEADDLIAADGNRWYVSR
jgi:glucose-6-phosphate 1-dehydrogenase